MHKKYSLPVYTDNWNDPINVLDLCQRLAHILFIIRLPTNIFLNSFDQKVLEEIFNKYLKKLTVEQIDKMAELLMDKRWKEIKLE
jgi:hypothetical protein